MLASPIAVTGLSDLMGSDQNASAPENGGGFLALLNAGNGSDAFGNGDTTNNDGNANSPVNNNTPVNVPTSVFVTNNSQNTPPPAPQPPQSPQSTQTPQSSADNQGNAAAAQNNNQVDNQPQNLPAPPASQSTTQANATQNQNISQPLSGQPQAQGSSGQADANTTQPANQLRSQIQNQLSDLSQLLLSMIQALSATAPQQLQQTVANTVVAGSSTQTVSGNTNSAGSGRQAGTGGASQTGQEISLLQDMQSLLQQMQQSLAGQGQQGQDQGGPNFLQTLSDSLMSDMAKLSQLMNSSSGGDGSNAPSSLLSATQFSDLETTIKNSLTQITSQLQIFQATNNAITQATGDFQPVPVVTDVTGQTKTTAQSNDTNNVPANNATLPVTTGDAPSAPASQNVPVKPDANTPAFLPTSPNQVGASQNSGASTGGGNQDFSQNQTAQPTVPVSQASLPAPSTSIGGASFTKILGQVSQGDVLNQIQFQVKTALADGSSKISIQLNPPDLGKVDVKLDISADGKASGITIVATNQDTLNLLQRDPQGLANALKSAGLTTDSGSLNFSLGGQQNQPQAGSQQVANTYQQAQPDDDNDTAINVITRSYVVNLAEGLDITI